MSTAIVVLAALGYKALILMYIWLGSAIIASMLSRSKGYGEKPGLGTGMLLSFVGPIIWLFWPAKPDSKWKTLGPIGRGKSTEERLEAVDRATSG